MQRKISPSSWRGAYCPTSVLTTEDTDDTEDQYKRPIELRPEEPPSVRGDVGARDILAVVPHFSVFFGGGSDEPAVDDHHLQGGCEDEEGGRDGQETHDIEADESRSCSCEHLGEEIPASGKGI